MKQLLILCMLLVGGSRAFGQASVYNWVEGTVRDSLTRQPIQGASIRMDFGKTGITTNAEGKFRFSVLVGRAHVMSITHVGYRAYRLKFEGADNLSLKISLQPFSQELEEVIVTSQGTEKNVNRPLLGVTSLSIKTLKKLPAFMGETDVLRGLQMLPGVTSVGEASNGVNIRGGTTDQNLILLDDAPIFNPTHLFGLFSVFPPDAISSVELFKGGIPARFGGRTASVLDITMSLPSLEKFKLQGGISLVANRLTVEVPLIKNKLGLLVAGRGSFNDFLFKLGPIKLQNIKANFGDLATKLFYQVNQKNTITLSSYWSKDFFQTDLLGTIGTINATSTQYDYKALNGTLKWFHAFGPALNLQTVAVYSNYQPKTLLPELNKDNKVSIESAITYQNLKSSLSYQPDARQKIEMGLSATRYNIAPGLLNPGSSVSVNRVKVPEENALELGLFADDEITISPKLTILAGLRYSQYFEIGPKTVRNYRPGEPRDAFSVTDSTVYSSGQIIKSYGGFEPRLSFKYSLNEASSFKFGYSLMRQYLQVISNTTTPLPTARWKTSDTYFRPQISHLISGGYFRNTKDNIYELSFEGYFRQTQNILDYKPGADFLLQRFLETEVLQGKNLSYGAELMITKKKGELTGWLSYTYSRSLNQVNEGRSTVEQINNGRWYAANYDRPHSLNATISVAGNEINTFSFNFSYSTGRPFTSPSALVVFQRQSYPFYDVRNNDRIKDYHRLDFSWTIDNPNRQKEHRWKGSWTFTVYNLYGRKNPYSVFLRSRGAYRVEPYQLVIFGSPFASLTYNFKFL